MKIAKWTTRTPAQQSQRAGRFQNGRKYFNMQNTSTPLNTPNITHGNGTLSPERTLSKKINANTASEASAIPR